MVRSVNGRCLDDRLQRFAGDLRKDTEKKKRAGKWRYWRVFGHVKVKEERNMKTEKGG
jgi:hypothetical protein